MMLAMHSNHTAASDRSLADARRPIGIHSVEILIVVVIIGVLATVTVMAIRGTTDRASENACENERKSLQTAHEAYLVKEEVDTVPATGTGRTASNSR